MNGISFTNRGKITVEPFLITRIMQILDSLGLDSEYGEILRTKNFRYGMKGIALVLACHASMIMRTHRRDRELLCGHVLQKRIFEAWETHISSRDTWGAVKYSQYILELNEITKKVADHIAPTDTRFGKPAMWSLMENKSLLNSLGWEFVPGTGLYREIKSSIAEWNFSCKATAVNQLIGERNVA